MPPVEDAELIQRIRATNAGDSDNDLSSWKCRRCKKNKDGGSRATPSASAAPSREHTVSSDTVVVSPRSSVAAGNTISPTTTPSSQAVIAPKVEVPPEQPLSAGVGVHPLNDRERDKKNSVQESQKQVPSQRTLTAKRTKPSQSPVCRPAKRPRDQPADVQMSDAEPTKFTGGIVDGEEIPSETPLDYVALFVSSAMNLPEDDDQMDVEISPPASFTHASHSAPPALDALQLDSQVRAKEPKTQPPAIEDIDMESQGAERRIIRILPSLAEELREQQRQVAETLKSNRAPLVPDWILQRHSEDPRWLESPNRTKGRKHSKAFARKRGEHGVDVNNLLGFFTAKKWIQVHKS
ncbi:hypothetical protein BU15DRAFT_60296 [Melanogaster broomeanus]|nr:hypothetical protein BU15DRAFT_60296 [Melanogaster broomeanus]